MQRNGHPPTAEQVLTNVIALVKTAFERECDPMRRMILGTSVMRLTEGLWWLNASEQAGKLVRMP